MDFPEEEEGARLTPASRFACLGRQWMPGKVARKRVVVEGKVGWAETWSSIYKPRQINDP
jgi:hypothetical protein